MFYGVALVVAISALTRGLDHAQKTALNPLSSIGTDLAVTRGTRGGQGGRPAASVRIARCSRRTAVLTDLSRLGKPGQHFVHDFFLPGTQLTFSQRQAQGAVWSLPGVATASSGLVLVAEHQQGVVPSK